MFHFNHLTICSHQDVITAEDIEVWVGAVVKALWPLLADGERETRELLLFVVREHGQLGRKSNCFWVQRQRDLFLQQFWAQRSLFRYCIPICVLYPLFKTKCLDIVLVLSNHPVVAPRLVLEEQTRAMRQTLEVQSRAMQRTIETQGRQVSRLAARPVVVVVVAACGWTPRFQETGNWSLRDFLDVGRKR